MPGFETQIKQEIAHLKELRDQAEGAVANVLLLLGKADERRATEEERRWSRIVENLEDALHLARAKVTLYEQQLKDRERHLQEILNKPAGALGAGAGLGDEFRVSGGHELQPSDIPLPRDHVEVAERVLAISLEDLGQMTLDEVAEMNTGLFEDAEAVSTVPASAEAELIKKTQLAEKIEHAKQMRQSLAASRHSDEPSFVERRRQKTLKDALSKVIAGDLKAMPLEEIEVVMQYQASLTGRAEVSESDQRLRGILAEASAGLQERASELRRKRAQTYTKKRL